MNVNSISFNSSYIKKIKNILEELLYISFPMTLNVGCLRILNTINISFLSNKYASIKMIDALGASLLYLNCTTFIITVGLVITMDTLCSNALGANHKYLMALYLNRTRLISFTFMIISILINQIFALDFIYFLTKDIEIVNYSESFIFKYYIALFLELAFRINMSYLTIVNKSIVCSIIQIISTLLHFIWCYIFIYQLNQGIAGVAYAVIITQALNLILSSMYLYFYNPFPEVHFFINKDCFSGWKEYLKLGVPVTFTLISEWLGYEIQSIIAMQAGALDYSIHIILVNLEMLIYSIGLGMSISVNVRLADGIVSSDIETCKRKLKIWLIFCFFSMFFISIILYLIREFIIDVYTKDSKSKEILMNMFYLICLYIFIENQRIFLLGIFRGLSFLTIPTIIQFIFIYVTTISLSYLLALKFGYGVKGIWIAYFISYLMIYLIFLFLYFKLDFQHFRNKTLNRIEADKNFLDSKRVLDISKIKNEDQT